MLREHGAAGVSGALVTGRLSLEFAEIDFPVRLEDCEFEHPPDFSWASLRFLSLAGSRLPGLNAANATIDGDLVLTGVESTGGLDLGGVRVAGRLTLHRAVVTGERALFADKAVIGADVSARSATFTGPVHLFGARCAGFDLDDATVTAPGGVAVAADAMDVDGGFFARRCTIDGEVRLRHATVGDALTFTGSTLRNPGAVALRLARATVDGGLWIADASVDGEVRAVSARIGRTLRITGADLRAPGGVALSLTGATVDGEIDGREGLRVTGALLLEDATVAGPIRLGGATLHHPGGDALVANGLRTTSTFECGVTATGRVRLSSAQIGTRLSFDGADLGGAALHCWRVQAGEMALRWAVPPGAVADFRYGRTGVLRDDPRTWPSTLLLDGLVYDVLEPLRDRVDWVSRDPGGHRRQPYEQLATVLRGQGHGDEARRVLLARQRRDTRRAARLPKAWGYLQEATVGYGYQPVRAAVIFAGLLLLGTVVFGLHPPAAAEPAKAPPFNALVYTLDVLMPVVDFGQQNAFLPRGVYQWISYFLIVAGLILATTIAAALSRSLRRS